MVTQNWKDADKDRELFSLLVDVQVSSRHTKNEDRYLCLNSFGSHALFDDFVFIDRPVKKRIAEFSR
jgi:hypothetical protein